MKRLFKIAVLAGLCLCVCSVKDISAQADEDRGLAIPPMLMFKVRVDGKSKERLHRPLTDNDFEVSRYQKNYEIHFFKEIEGDLKRYRLFEIGVLLDPRYAWESWVSDRMTVSMVSSRKTWGLTSKVLQRRIVEQ